MRPDDSAPIAHRVVVLLLAPVVGFDATIPSTLFGQAADAAGNPLYDVRTCGLDEAPVATTTGYGLVPSGGPDLLATADTVVVPGTRYPSARREGTVSAELAAALALIPGSARVVSICTGAFVLAAAGYFEGRRATTHWRAADDFRAVYPDVDLDEAVLFVDDGPVLSSAGLAAGIDLCLHIIRSDHGSVVANEVARYCVVPPWREGGQAQFISAAVPDDDHHSTAATRAWASENLTEPLTVSRLAAHAQMSSRTFNRRFRDETGDSPGTWVRKRRVDRARELLERRDLSIDTVATLSGLGSADNLRHHLRQGIGMSPSAYRRTFTGAR